MSAFWSRHPVDVVVVTGADALSYLQGQISQDINNLADGESAYSFLLQPAGKVDVLIRVLRVSSDRFVVDTDAGFGEQAAARLARFRIRVDVQLVTETWDCVAVRGVVAQRPAGARPAWGLDDAYDLIERDVVPAPTDIVEGSAEQLERARIEAGWPAMGAEITEATIPAEIGHVVGRAVSFTKGCYPGQELVERMDSRGSSAPRVVRRLRGSGLVAVATVVEHGGADVGAVTSIASDAAGWVALAVISRRVQVGDTVAVRDAGPALVEDAAPVADR